MKLALATILLAACSGVDGTSVLATSADAPPAYATTPFPTDALRDGTHLATLAGIDTFVARYSDIVASHIAALDGFGVRPLVEFFVDGDIDPASFTSDTVGLVDVDDTSPERGRVVALEVHYDGDRRALQAALASGELLREGTRYAAFVTTAVHDTSGAAIHRSDALDELVSSPAPRWQSTADGYRALARADLAGVAVFTTQHATAPLVAARDVMLAQPLPDLAFTDPSIVFTGTAAIDQIIGQATRATDGPRTGLERWGNDNPTGIAHDHVGMIATGTTTSVRFRRDDTGTNGPEDETFDLDASGTPRIISVDTIPITFIVPSTPAPPTGYPVVIYGHGLGASRDQLLSFAEPLTSRGYVLVGIDMVGHGSRYDARDNYANMANQLHAFSGDPLRHDGFGDTTGIATQFDFFEGFLGVSAIRDSIRQSALDLVRVAQLVRRPDLDLSALGGIKLDTSHLAYMGESFGTVVGTVFAAIEPSIDLFVLDVPGGGIVDHLLPESAEIGSLALPIIESIYNPKFRIDRWSPLIALMQATIDGADPLTYAPHVLADRFPNVGARSVVCLEVVGDQVLSNSGTIALAQELHLDVLTPDLAPPSGLVELASPAAGNRDGMTAILVQYSPATHGANWSSEHGTLKYLPGFPQPGDDPFPKLPAPITIDNPIYDTLDQVFDILATHQAGAAPMVRSTRAPIADFDGDGVPDAQDSAPYDPTQH